MMSGELEGQAQVAPVLTIEVSLSQDGSITVTAPDAGAVAVKDATEAGALVVQLLQNVGKSPEQVSTEQSVTEQAAGYQQ